MTLKILDSNIKSTDPSFLGWVACIICYQPIWAHFSANYFSYDDNIFWGDFFDGSTAILIIWGGIITASLIIYSFASVAFGYRFSNLTYRGIITNGPYRYTKHPAYIFKNLTWWMISMPFVYNDDWQIALRNCAGLFMVNCIYYIRARTEENHLSNYPEYVKYAEWMNEHGMFSKLGKLIPYFQYSKEKALKSGSKIYKPFANQ